MNPHYLQTIMDETIKTVGVRFDKSVHAKTYTYKTRLDLEPGDDVLVCVSGEFKIVYVVEVHDVPNIDEHSRADYKWIVQKLDMSAYQDMLDEDEEFKESTRKHLRMIRRRQFLETLEPEYKELINNYGKEVIIDHEPIHRDNSASEDSNS